MADVPYAFPDGGRKQLPTFIQQKCLSGMDESIRSWNRLSSGTIAGVCLQADQTSGEVAVYLVLGNRRTFLQRTVIKIAGAQRQENRGS